MTKFRDFNFKLLVIEQLMYTDRVLGEPFDLARYMQEHRGVDDLYQYGYENELGYTVLDEARHYFDSLELSTEQLAIVEELVIDGGSEVYMQCTSTWDGEDDLFDVRSLEDLDLLPNLKRIDGAEESLLAVPDKLEILRARGIAAV
ncbi:hypothetical protein DSC45_02630 [Streptomyces sp. YIM 130001]|uniref:DUF6892 domain-containing protein n=1 Tax=Streptomyces sp. YIM 130001 TaxID=2259644 RepID=UPI000E64799C|nr:hypothetical protein [Streptomyces sp. YIM 130001]RII20716.1 hypothetical protein DSC45_02630 [Streptomyces sp. YIM 130001]